MTKDLCFVLLVDKIDMSHVSGYIIFLQLYRMETVLVEVCIKERCNFDNQNLKKIIFLLLALEKLKISHKFSASLVCNL